MRRRPRATIRSVNPSERELFWSLVQLARRLQAPGGCPWDRAQTVSSLFPHLIEEVWEAFCAEQSGLSDEFEEELGDVLYTTLFLALLAEREGWFTLAALLTKTQEKMVRRHPHVFGDRQADTATEAYRQWQRIKRQERPKASDSKRMRPLLLSLWRALRGDQATRAAARALLKPTTDRRTSGMSTPASGKPAKRRGRSLGPA